MKRIFFFLLAISAGNNLFAQKIKTDEIDKTTKLRFIETDNKKVSISDIQLTPSDGIFGETRTVQLSMLAFGANKYLHLSWTNTNPLTLHNIDSIIMYDNQKNQVLKIADFSVLGRKKNMVAEGNVTLYGNELYLQGDFSNPINSFKLILNTKEEMKITLTNKEATFVNQANILVTNVAASEKTK